MTSITIIVCFTEQNFTEIGQSALSYDQKTIFKMGDMSTILNFKKSYLVT